MGQGVCIHSLNLSRNGEDALGHILDIGSCDPSHGDPTVVGEVNVRVFADLEHLASRSQADNIRARSVRDARKGGRQLMGMTTAPEPLLQQEALTWATPHHRIRS